MKLVFWLPSSLALLFILSGCATNDPVVANDPLGTGPFDSHGNYREEWADDPSKWRKPGSRQQAPADDLPVIARNEQPPPNATPLAAGSSTKPKPTPAPVKTTASTSRPKPSSSATTAQKPKPVVVKAKPKPKPKPKPQSTRYVVKKGDTLSGIASRYGSSVSKIRSANGISGSLIRPGQKLIVPKR